MPKRTREYRDSLLADLRDPSEATAYLNAALDDSEEMFLVALRDVAAAKQMSKVASEIGVGRETVYQMLSESGNLTLSDLLGIFAVLGLRMRLAPLESPLESHARPRAVSDSSISSLTRLEKQPRAKKKA